MKRGLIVFIVLLILVGIVALWGVGQYNGLVKQQEGVKTAWSQVENVYQRRYDLIPNLVETVKGVADFERDTYTAVADARARVGQLHVSVDDLDDPATLQKLEAVQGELSGALSRLFAVAEQYPQLKANQNFLDLQSQLEGMENRITVERRRFNEVAQAYNTKVRTVPTVIIARLFGFHEKPYFQSVPGAEAPPKVEF
jgi:LemA protein